MLLNFERKNPMRASFRCSFHAPFALSTSPFPSASRRLKCFKPGGFDGIMEHIVVREGRWAIDRDLHGCKSRETLVDINPSTLLGVPTTLYKDLV